MQTPRLRYLLPESSESNKPEADAQSFFITFRTCCLIFLPRERPFSPMGLFATAKWGLIPYQHFANISASKGEFVQGSEGFAEVVELADTPS